MGGNVLHQAEHHFALRCLMCNTVIMSLRRHSMVYCGCGNYANVDGGFEYFKAGAKDVTKVESIKIKIK